MIKNKIMAIATTISLLVTLHATAATADAALQQQDVNTADWSEETLLSSPEQVNGMKIPVKAKAIYLTGWSAGNSNFQKLLSLVNETELNAMVIDVKEDEGRVTYKSAVPLVNQVKSDGTRFIQDVDKMIQTLNENRVYTIA